VIKIGILAGARGRGSNSVALVEAARRGDFPGEVSIVVAPDANAPVLEKVAESGIRTAVAATEEDLLAAFDGCDWICLAGYMRLLPPAVLHRWTNRILNIHPSLLPKYGGKGMYGLHVHRAVLAAGESESGCTVHRVSEVYDEGEVIHQLTCPVAPHDTPESLAARVLALEHQAYPQALQRVLAS
jgi:phosphoribosylglycinamide formyltransferase 1